MGAIAIVVVGVLLCGAAALLSTDEFAGGAYLDWDDSAPIPGSTPSTAGGLAARIVGGQIDTTRLNASGYKLYEVTAGLRIRTARPDDRATASCRISVAPPSVLGRTPGKRASYPLPSEDLSAQSVPEGAVVRFYAKGTDIVIVPLSDALPKFTSAPGVKVDWAPYRQGEQTWNWVLTGAARPSRAVQLGFATLWRTTARPGARISCRVEDGGRRVAARTSGRL
jgi:hypothetical protein